MPLSSIDLSWARMSLIPGIRSGKKQFYKSSCFNVLEDGCCKHRACIMSLVEAVSLEKQLLFLWSIAGAGKLYFRLLIAAV